MNMKGVWRGERLAQAEGRRIRQLAFLPELLKLAD